MLLTIRTDNPDAEIGVHSPDGTQLDYHKWRADRDLARDILTVIRDRLATQKATWKDITGLVVFQGPGSFTGLRIGLTVANTIAYAQNAPVIAAQGEDWIATGISRLKNNENDKLVLPHYGSEPNITLPKK